MAVKQDNQVFRQMQNKEKDQLRFDLKRSRHRTKSKQNKIQTKDGYKVKPTRYEEKIKKEDKTKINSSKGDEEVVECPV